MRHPAFLAAALAAFAGPVLAAGVLPGPIQADHAWIRATPPGAITAAGYLELTNRGATVDQLIGGSSPLARSVTAHQSVVSKGVVRMSAVASMPLAPGQTASFKPGGYHLMLTGLTQPLTVGQHVPVTLQFQHAGPVKLEFVVQQAAAAGGAMPGMTMKHTP